MARLTRKNAVVPVISAVFLLVLISIVFTSASSVLIKLGNAEFSAKNEKLGTLSYNLALGLNSELNDAANQCESDVAQMRY